MPLPTIIDLRLYNTILRGQMRGRNKTHLLLGHPNAVKKLGSVREKDPPIIIKLTDPKVTVTATKKTFCTTGQSAHKREDESPFGTAISGARARRQIRRYQTEAIEASRLQLSGYGLSPILKMWTKCTMIGFKLSGEGNSGEGYELRCHDMASYYRQFNNFTNTAAGMYMAYDQAEYETNSKNFNRRWMDFIKMTIHHRKRGGDIGVASISVSRTGYVSITLQNFTKPSDALYIVHIVYSLCERFYTKVNDNAMQFKVQSQIF